MRRILDTIAMATGALEGKAIQMPNPRSPSTQKYSLMTNGDQRCHRTPSLILLLPNVYPASISPSAGSSFDLRTHTNIDPTIIAVQHYK